MVRMTLWPLLAAERLRRQEGQTMAEYAIILAVIVVLALGAFTILSGGIGNALQKVTNLLNNPTGP